MKRFSGAYREKITGLIPGSELTPVTIQGEFHLDQTSMDDSELLWGALPIITVPAPTAATPEQKYVSTVTMSLV